MGNSASGDTGRHRYGYHVLRVKDNSPASQAGLRPFFDYIMAVNGIRLNTEDSTLREQMEASEDKPMMLDVYSTRERELRKVEMTPTLNWRDGTEGSVGCSVRFCLFDIINDIVWHVLDIAPNSPAELAGFCAHTDYIIGTPLGVMRGESDLYDLVEDYIGEPMPLHVYNVEANEVREVVITPSDEWGGEGLLGCDVGYGYLHRLPKDSVRRQEAKGSQNRTEKQRVEPEADDLPLLGAPENDVMPLAPTEGEEYCEKKEVTQEHIHIAVQPLIVQDSSRHEMTEYVDVDSENMSQATKINTLGSPLQIPDSILRPQVEVHDTENIPMSSEETLSTMEVEHASPSQESDQAPLLQEEDQVPPESETELRHQPPPALAARMKPGIHGRGVRVGHDGNPTQGKTPLKDVQDQAQQHSAEYREKLQDKQDKEDTRNHQQELQNANTDVPEYVLEGMIRNMALGASVFPL